MKKSAILFILLFITFPVFMQGKALSINEESAIRNRYSYFLRDLQKIVLVNLAAGQHNLNDAVEGLLDLAASNLKKGRIDYAMRQVFRAQELLKHQGVNHSLSGRCSQMLGNLFYARHMRKESIASYRQSLEFFAAGRNPENSAEVLNSMMECYFVVGDTLNAKKCINALRILSHQINDVYVTGLENETIGDFNYFMGEFDSSTVYYKKSLVNYFQLENNVKISNVFLSMGLCDFSAGNFESSIYWVDSALVFNKAVNQPKNYYEAMYFKAMLISFSDPLEGLDIAYSVLDSLEEMQLYIHMGVYLSLIINLERQTKDFESALIYSDMFKQITNYISGSGVERKIAGLQLDFESERLNHRIGLLQKEQELTSVNTRSQRNMLFYFFLTIIVLFAMALNNMRRLQYRLYLLKEFALDFSWPQYLIAFIISLLYFSVLLSFINPLNFAHASALKSWMHYSFISFILSTLATAGIFALPVRWSAKPGFNRRFVSMSFAFVVLMNAAVLIYAALSGVLSKSIFDYLNVLLVVTGITIIPVFYFIIYLEKVLLRKHIQMAGMLSNRLQSVKPDKSKEIVTIYSKRSRDILEVAADNLLLIEANGNYSKAHYLEEGNLKNMLILTPLTKAANQLANYSCFTRCHNSYIINLNKITKVYGNSHGYKLTIPFFEETIPVSRGYIANFIKDFDAIFKDGDNRIVK